MLADSVFEVISIAIANDGSVQHGMEDIVFLVVHCVRIKRGRVP